MLPAHEFCFAWETRCRLFEEGLRAKGTEIEELKKQLAQERNDAASMHTKVMAGLREVSDLKRQIADRDKLLGSSSNAKARVGTRVGTRSGVHSA